MAATSTANRTPTGVGPYALVERLGKGGMGTVYRAVERDTGAVVAVKILAPALAENPVLLGRFVQEFRAAAKLDHPNIVRALDSGTDGPFTYLVMEYVEGKSLGRMLARGVRLPERTAVRVVTQVAQALEYAHRHRVIHRDVKPDNILIRPDGLAKLADFGLAKDVDGNRDLTRTNRCLGTPHFMAPEQYVDAKNVGVPSDIYSLGATLYNALTGKIPFADCATFAALANKVKGEIRSPRELVPEISPQADLAVRRAMSPNPGKRPTSALQFIKLLPPAGPAPEPPASVSASTPARRPARRDPERRTYVRRVCSLPTVCRVDPDVFPGGTDGEEWPATVHDISATGVGLILARRFEPGTLFAVQMEGGIGKPVRHIVARVVRVQAEDFGHWFHGCTIVPADQPPKG